MKQKLDLIPAPRRRRMHPAALFAMMLLCCMLVSGATAAGVFYLLDRDDAPVSQTTASTGTIRTLAVSGTAAGSLADVVEKTAPSVVEVFTETKQVGTMFQDYVTEGAGSGVILSADGYIATNHHVIAGANTIKTRLANGDTCPATLVASDTKTDLALLKIERQNLKAAVLADSAKVRVGDQVIAIGNPLGELGGTVTEGIISALDRTVTIEHEPMTLLQTSAAVNPGNSGGGLFDTNGQLVGIVNSKTSGDGIEGLAFAIPANTVQIVVAELLQNGYVTGRPQLGISVAEISNWYLAMQYRVQELGVYITAVSVDSGLQTGDRIVSMDGTAINSGADISTVLNRHQLGDTVTVDVKRNGQTQSVNVTLTEMTPAS